MILYMYIAPGQGLKTPWGRNFDVNRNILSTSVICCKFKKISLKSDFIHFFYDFVHVCSPGAGAAAPRVQRFYVNRNVLSLHSFVVSFKNVFEV